MPTTEVSGNHRLGKMWSTANEGQPRTTSTQNSGVGPLALITLVRAREEPVPTP